MVLQGRMGGLESPEFAQVPLYPRNNGKAICLGRSILL